jgi:hypothetical protein
VTTEEASDVREGFVETRQEKFPDFEEASVTDHVGKRRKRDAQFVQQFSTGSNSQHFNCVGPNGCGNIPGIQQIIGGQVT